MSITVNKKAFHDYFVEEKFEAGLALMGWQGQDNSAHALTSKES